ncbi:DUF4367 domain-containing protein [Clostridioides difficile]|uniref:DUF4367 domain-containing protein n=1 Tax=Clostridioides difficile TaxID=1496 RepID=A0A386JBJ6_CLODI|nr:DUF4367 domain-containing protein [Clostridioides difficile]AYD68629.1 hypothetical protein pHSJD-312_00006 [Clostridioides difficile]EQF26864.1 hypothetical protein QEW_1033 [Clostridioides difficile CD160]MDI2882264.1 DUF4367 domain-containing protein [Clostridioides difficile]MDI3004353.1 DUF4367 domain-containing protein [Clostridioides difficile]
MSKINITDEMLYRHASNAEKIILDQLPPDEELNHVFSKRFERKMKKLIRQEKRNPFIKYTVIYLKRVVVVFLIVVTGLFTITMSVDALRNQFIKIVIEIYEDLTEFIFSKDIQTDKELDFILKEPKYIPKGFKEVERESSKESIFIGYENTKGDEIRYRSNQINSSSVIIDTENAEVSNITINKNKAKYVVKDDTIILFWNDEKDTYTIYLDSINKEHLKNYKEELLKIAENIK